MIYALVVYGGMRLVHPVLIGTAVELRLIDVVRQDILKGYILICYFG